jgi:hypothetical protein
MSKLRVPLDLAGLDGRRDIFRLSGAVRRAPPVEHWLTGEPTELRALARQWFSHIRRCGNDVLELMHDDGPTACVGDAAFAQVNAFKNHVNVGFFHGASLADPARLLAGSGKRMRHVKLIPGKVIDESALKKLIDAAYVDIKARLDDDMI